MTTKRLTTKEFIDRSIKIHGNKYDYSKIQYINSKSKINIICPIHGEFWQRPERHMIGEGCRKCGYNTIRVKRLSSIDQFIQKAIKIHGEKYDYSNVEYHGNKNKIRIGCRLHGEFQQTPNNHLRGQTCPECSQLIIADKNRKTTRQFIEDAKKVHGNKYDYSNVIYNHNQKSKVIICCSLHGKFLQSPHNHLCGAGCPQCQASHGEQKITLILDEKNLLYQRQKTFNNCRSPKGRMLKFDFYIPDKNIIIEYDGPQHYGHLRIGKYTLKKQEYERLKVYDALKNNYARNNNIRLLRIPYWEKNIESVLNPYL